MEPPFFLYFIHEKKAEFKAVYFFRKKKRPIEASRIQTKKAIRTKRKRRCEKSQRLFRPWKKMSAPAKSTGFAYQNEAGDSREATAKTSAAGSYSSTHFA